MSPLLTESKYKNDYVQQVKNKSDVLVNYALACYFIVGLGLTFFYNTWSVAVSVGGFSIIAYYAAKHFLPRSDFYQYVLSAVLGIFMVQYIYQVQGLYEMHFAAFIGSAMLVTYQKWKLQLPLLTVVIVHHALFAYLQFKGVGDVYFAQSGYLDVQTVIMHILFTSVTFCLCGVWAYLLNKYSTIYNKLNFDMGRMEEEEEQKMKLLQMRDHLKAGNTRLNEAEEIAGIGNWERNYVNNILIWSDQMFRIFDIEKTGFNVSYDAYLSFIHPDDRENVKRIDKNYELDHQPFKYECRIITLKGIAKTIYMQGKVVVNDKSQVIKTLGVVQDITESKRVHDELLNKNNELSKANAELDSIVYCTSNDLRSPLSSVLGLANFIEEETKEPATLKHARMIKSRIKRIDDLVVNIHNYTLNNRQDVKPERICFDKVIWESINSQHHVKEAAKIDFRIQVNQNEAFHSDEQRIATVLNNMVSNGIKFRNPEVDNPFIAIHVNTTAQDAEIIFEDNGMGISKEHHHKIFDLFYCTEPVTPGSGIGLYLVKEIVDKLKGNIHFDSMKGQGTRFKINLKNLINASNN